MEGLENKIVKAIEKFDLQLGEKTVLTEAASGNYVVTPVIAALAGAKKVYALSKESRYASVNDVFNQTISLAKKLNIQNTIELVTSLDSIDLKKVDILTNTGFLRPIDENLINQLSSKCVIPLMWETWEFREKELDIQACLRKGVKVYGTNEDDERLKTKVYIGYMVLTFLLDLKHTPLSSRILVLGCEFFTSYAEMVLKQNGYVYEIVNLYDKEIDVAQFDAIIIMEHHENKLLIGDHGYIKTNELKKSQDIIHICGNVDFSKLQCNFIPQKPAAFGYMSYTADYMGSQVVIDLHTAGLKVAEGMLEANKLDLKGCDYKSYMERKYPAMSFEEKRYW